MMFKKKQKEFDLISCSFYKSRVMKIFNFFLLFLVLNPFRILNADVLTLKDGRTIENVKATIEEKYLRIKHSSGRQELIKKVAVKTLKLKPVIWTNELSPGEFQKDLYEKERIRVADALLANSEWVLPEGEKPRLIFIDFRAGQGISKAKAEALSNIIRTKVSKTGLFVLIDSRSIQKALEKKNVPGLSVPHSFHPNSGQTKC
ncbi:MAG: hypothetical protein H7A25_03130 [Leptospiraceae bacterium]|nr:hypothetical protein [Leptospiraceae bacterium]MCP5498870.1 hypothetical protein [Leptospiraceae bacterium]